MVQIARFMFSSHSPSYQRSRDARLGDIPADPNPEDWCRNLSHVPELTTRTPTTTTSSKGGYGIPDPAHPSNQPGHVAVVEKVHGVTNRKLVVAMPGVIEYAQVDSFASSRSGIHTSYGTRTAWVPGVLVSLAALNVSDGPDDRHTPCLIVPPTSWLRYHRCMRQVSRQVVDSLSLDASVLTEVVS